MSRIREKEKKKKTFIHMPDTVTNQFLLLPAFFQLAPMCLCNLYTVAIIYVHVSKLRGILTPFLSASAHLKVRCP